MILLENSLYLHSVSSHHDCAVLQKQKGKGWIKEKYKHSYFVSMQSHNAKRNVQDMAQKMNKNPKSRG